MAKNEKTALEVSKVAFSDNAEFLRFTADVSQSEVGREVNKRGTKVAGKTVNNIFAGRFPSELGNFAAIADYFGVPLWVMFIPGMDKDLLKKPGLERLVKLMNDYMNCSPELREKIENVADTFASVTKIT